MNLNARKQQTFQATVSLYAVDRARNAIVYCLVVDVLCVGFAYSLWQLLQADNSHVASVAVPLLIHCLAQTTGANVFWELVENDFNNEDWKVRFSAG